MQAVNKIYTLDERAEKIGLITGISEEIYFCSISKVSQVYLEKVDNNWVAWRESFIPNTNKRANYKIIANGDYDFVLARLKNYLNYIKKNTVK
ncbi:pathogenicity island protein [Staphylococcus delphini]|uniref:pathogenicity island protein n=2 Tax=Staphylococcus intermedius group TaxID=2815305 RepID=UPI0013629B1F|nr:pathogenicity island protein [Staphylococcus delphini]